MEVFAIHLSADKHSFRMQGSTNWSQLFLYAIATRREEWRRRLTRGACKKVI